MSRTPPPHFIPGNWLRYPLNRHVSGLRSGGLEALENRKNPCPCQQTNPAPSVVPFVARINTAAIAVCHWLTYRQKSTRIHIFVLKLSFSNCHNPSVFRVNRSWQPLIWSAFFLPSHTINSGSSPLHTDSVPVHPTHHIYAGCVPNCFFRPIPEHLSLPFLCTSVWWLSYPSTFSKKAYLTAWPKCSTVSDL